MSNEAQRILEKYPDRIPIILNKAKNSKIDDINKKKFLIPKDLTVGQFLFVIRKKINLKPEIAVFLFTNNSIPSTNEMIGNLYANNKSEDGFLYMEYSGENTFGFFNNL